MRALVLGARGAVGRVIVDALRQAGDEVTPAGRRDGDNGLRIDLSTDEGLRGLARAARGYDVVVNASGVERPAVASAFGPGTAVLVEISATGRYLRGLAQAAPPGAGLVLGAGLAPGLSTILISALDAEPGDDVDLAVMLGAGEQHGDAAVEWTIALLGTTLFDPPEPHPVTNLRQHRSMIGPDGRRRRYLRADFPDHLLIGRSRGLSVRSYLTLSSAAATTALAVGARLPGAAALLRQAPHWGSSDWHLLAANRRTGESLSAGGSGQSRATGLLTAMAAQRVAADPVGSVVTMADVMTYDDFRSRW